MTNAHHARGSMHLGLLVYDDADAGPRRESRVAYLEARPAPERRDDERFTTICETSSTRPPRSE